MVPMMTMTLVLMLASTQLNHIIKMWKSLVGQNFSEEKIRRT